MRFIVIQQANHSSSICTQNKCDAMLVGENQFSISLNAFTQWLSIIAMCV